MIGYVRKCLAMKKNGDPCTSVNYVNGEGRCGSHRDHKFHVNPADLKTMIEFEMWWSLFHDRANESIREQAKAGMAKILSEFPDEYQKVLAGWKADNITPDGRADTYGARKRLTGA